MSDSPPEPLTATVDAFEEWFFAQLKAGVERLGVDAQFAAAMLPILQRQAIAQCLAGRDAGAPLDDWEPHVEAELQQRSPFKGRDLGIDGENDEALRSQQLLELLVRYEELAVKARWLQQTRDMLGRPLGGPISIEPPLAAALVGIAIAEGHPRAAALRQSVLRNRTFALAAWVAVLDGDALGCYLDLQAKEEDPLWVIEGAFVCAHAMGGAGEGAVADEAARRAFLQGLAVLVALAPVWRDTDSFAPSLEEDSPLYLPHEDWRRAIFCLARFSRLFKVEAFPDLQAVWREPPAPLAQVLNGLGVPQRLTDDEVRAICGLCAPEIAAQQGLLQTPFWKTMQDVYGGVAGRWHSYWVSRNPTRAWYRRAVLALETWQPDYARTALVFPPDKQPASIMMTDEVTQALWVKHWTALLETEQAEQAAVAWAHSVTLVLPGQVIEDFLMGKAPMLLRARGVWTTATQRAGGLLRTLWWLGSGTTRDAGVTAWMRRLLQLLELPPEQLEQLWANTSPPSVTQPDDLAPFRACGIRPASILKKWLAWSEKTWPQQVGRDSITTLRVLLSLEDPEAYAALLEKVSAPPPFNARSPSPLWILYALPAGPWLDGLLRWLRDVRPVDGSLLLRRFGLRSLDIEVRRRCLQELLSCPS